MPFSTININALIEESIDSFIQLSDYPTLKNISTSLSPLPNIVDDVSTKLHILLVQEKETTSSKLISNACQLQIEHDLKEAENDAKESERDFNLSVKLQQELSQISHTIIENNNKKSEISIEIEKQKRTLSDTERSIALVSNQHTHTHETHENAPHQHQTAQGQQQTAVDTTNVHTHAHTSGTNQPETHSHPDTGTQLHQQHDHDESSLKNQRNQLLLSISELDYSIQRIQREDARHQDRIARINQELGVSLPAKQRQRDEDAFARQRRSNARCSIDPDFNQLSEKNRLSLQQSIIKEHRTLDKQCNEFIQRIREMSYPVYLTRLALLLDYLKHLAHAEQEALRQTLYFIDAYHGTQSSEQEETSKRNQLISDKQKLESALFHNQQDIVHFRESNPQLRAANESLSAQNQILEQTIEAREQSKSYPIKAGTVFSVVTFAALAGGFLGFHFIPLLFPPLFFVPAGLFALIATSLFIASLVMTIQNRMSTRQITQNESLIESNKATISSQLERMNSLEQNTVPKLKEQIEEANVKLEQMDRHIEDLKLKQTLFLSNAKNVTVASANNQSFFVEPQTASDTPLLQNHDHVTPEAIPLEIKLL